MYSELALFIDGKWLSGEGRKSEDVINPATGKALFEIEHEVRSLRHPMFQRQFINRNPEQVQRNYQRGRDGLIPFGS